MLHTDDVFCKDAESLSTLWCCQYFAPLSFWFWHSLACHVSVNLWSSLVGRADTEVEPRIYSRELKHKFPHALFCMLCAISLIVTRLLYFSIWHFGFFEVGLSIVPHCWRQSVMWVVEVDETQPLLRSLPPLPPIYPWAVVKASLFRSFSWVCDCRPTLRAVVWGSLKVVGVFFHQFNQHPQQAAEP